MKKDVEFVVMCRLWQSRLSLVGICVAFIAPKGFRAKRLCVKNVGKMFRTGRRCTDDFVILSTFLSSLKLIFVRP